MMQVRKEFEFLSQQDIETVLQTVGQGLVPGNLCETEGAQPCADRRISDYATDASRLAECFIEVSGKFLSDGGGIILPFETEAFLSRQVRAQQADRREYADNSFHNRNL